MTVVNGRLSFGANVGAGAPVARLTVRPAARVEGADATLVPEASEIPLADNGEFSVTLTPGTWAFLESVGANIGYAREVLKVVPPTGTVEYSTLQRVAGPTMVRDGSSPEIYRAEAPEVGRPAGSLRLAADGGLYWRLKT